MENNSISVTDDLIKGKQLAAKDLLPLQNVKEWLIMLVKVRLEQDTPLRERCNYIKDKLIREVLQL